MRRFAKWAGIIIGASLLVVTGLVALNRELRSFLLYAVAPASARDQNFILLEKNGSASTYLLGTIHDDHLSTPEFTLVHLKAAITNLRPQLLLVESRPEQIASGVLGDGPVEMPFAALSARELGIAVDGIDWWQRTEGARRTDESRDDRMYGHLKERIPSTGTVLVLVGFSHVGELADRLQKDGYQLSEMSDARKHELFVGASEPLSFPPGMTHAIEQRIAQLDAEIAAEPDGEWKERLGSVKKRRQALLDVIHATGERAESGGVR